MDEKKLYIVPTPIGNSEDITIRAIRILFSVDLIFSERPQKTKILLQKYAKDFPRLTHNSSIPKIISYNEYEENTKGESYMQFFDNHSSIALVSEAGTPTISDPGYRIVKTAYEHAVAIIPLSGPSAVTTAISSALMPTDSFYFIGFLPKKITKAQKILEHIRECNLNTTIVQYESPHRIKQTLELIQKVFGDIEIGICRELTKLHEEIKKEHASELLLELSKSTPKGEYVLLYHLGAKAAESRH